MADSKIGTSYLVLTGVIIITLTLIFTVIQPLISSIQSLRTEVASRRQTADAREAFLHTLDSKIAALASEAQHEQQLNVVLPVSEETEDVVRIIHQAQVTSGGTIRRLDNISGGVQSSLNARRARGEETAIPENIMPLGFEVEFTGSYQQLRVFMTEVQRAPRLVDITDLEIQRNTQIPDSLKATFTAEFYRYAETKK